LEVYSKVKHKKLRILDLLVKLTNSSCHTTGRKRKIFATIKTNAIAKRGEEDKRHRAVPAIYEKISVLILK